MWDHPTQARRSPRERGRERGGRREEGGEGRGEPRPPQIDPAKRARRPKKKLLCLVVYVLWLFGSCAVCLAAREHAYMNACVHITMHTRIHVYMYT